MQLEFRVWNNLFKEYVSPSSIYLNNEGKVIEDGEDGLSDVLDIMTIEHAIGIKDKNGKKIYEGDLLKDHEQIIKVVFDNDKHCFMFEYQSTHAYKPIYCLDVLEGEFEVVGNIHDKEVLK